MKLIGNEHEMSINEFSHYSFFLGLFVAFTYNKKKPPAFGATLAFWCILFPFLGLLFCHIPNNLSNYNVLTANAPFFYQISGTWSNHEGSILLWCWISRVYVFLLGRPQSHNVSKLRGYRETFLLSFVSNFVKNPILSLQQKGGAAPHLLYTSFVRYALVDSSLRGDFLLKRIGAPIEPLPPVEKPVDPRRDLLLNLTHRVEERVFSRSTEDILNPLSDRQVRETAQRVVNCLCRDRETDLPFLESFTATLERHPFLLDHLLDPFGV